MAKIKVLFFFLLGLIQNISLTLQSGNMTRSPPYKNSPSTNTPPTSITLGSRSLKQFNCIKTHYGFPPTIPEGTKLPDLCKLCNVEEKECTCKLQSIFCQIVDPKKRQTKRNKTSHVVTLDCDDTQDKVKASFNVVFGTIGFFGNFIVLLTAVVFRKKASRCQKLIAGLAGFDMLFSAPQVINYIPRFWTCAWLYGLPMCKLLNSCTNLSSLVSLGFIVIIAIERYVGIVHPFSRWLTRGVIVTMIVVNIAVAAIVSLPKAFFLGATEFSNNKTTCQEEWPGKNSSKAYSWFLFLAYFLIPIVIIVVLCYKIILTLRASINSQQNIFVQGHVDKRLSDNHRIMRIFLSILVAFVLLVLPNRIFWLVKDYSKLSNNEYKSLVLVGFIPYSMHGAINPILYSIVDKKFRGNAKKLMRILSSKKESEVLSGDSLGSNVPQSSVHLKSMKL